MIDICQYSICQLFPDVSIQIELVMSPLEWRRLRAKLTLLSRLGWNKCYSVIRQLFVRIVNCTGAHKLNEFFMSVAHIYIINIH